MSATGTPSRPLPTPDRDSRPWWEALARHELLLQRCDACEAWRWPARAMCGRCGSFETTWAPPSRRGTIASWVVNHHAFSAAFASPYAVVTVRLDEQPDLLLVGSFTGEVADLAVGLPVEAAFDDILAPPTEPGTDAAEPATLLTWQPVPGT